MNFHPAYTDNFDILESILVRAERMATVAAKHASDVDANARFPSEALAAARKEGLLSALVPKELGGEGASTAEIVDICYILGRACSATAMIFAMHQIKAACVVNHAQDSAWHRDFMARMVRDQLLLASSTTEGKSGGDVRNSAAAVTNMGETIALERAATVMSYGLQADAVVTTARRAADALSSDQVLVVFDKCDYSLTQTSAWSTLGMRGTCSAGFLMKACGHERQILPTPYALIHSQTMTPNAHLMWSSVWAGIAASAHERARMYLRKLARAADEAPIGIRHLNRAHAQLSAIRAMICTALAQYEAALRTPDGLSTMTFQTDITLLKVDVSELAVASVMSSLRACGLSGYREDGETSIGRHLRDILASPVMINNDRILGNLGMSTLLIETPRNLTF